MGELRHQEVALVAERFGIDPAELGPLIRGWVQRYDVAGAGRHVLHHVDPGDVFVRGEVHARAYCGLEMPRGQLWWRASAEATTAALAGAGGPWVACTGCVAGVVDADESGGGP